MKTVGIFLVVFAIAWLLVMLRIAFGSWRRAWCHLRGPCDWRWQFNMPHFVKMAISKHDGIGREQVMWVGRYRCSRCHDWSDGCARWEQRGRELDNTIAGCASL